MPDGHFDAYVKGFETSSAAALTWFRTHLAPRLQAFGVLVGALGDPADQRMGWC